ncbi:YcxB family protein [Sphingomonas sp.]|uniref:YcxB family protein n=1 Tax=Sphingomonas sp. TaxID=28214 RepID=UPI001EB19D63|nr:YcxB family protein [Sphingomonas sp.]MBX3595077.1 YcxB family protein [Sphingomonas sp.]
MSRTVKYVSRRSEVMRLYWCMWRKGLWKIHFLIFSGVVVMASVAFFDGAPTSFPGYLSVAGVGLLPIAFLALFPLFKFKPQQRTLTIDDEGIQTTIGQLSKHIPWEDVANASTEDENLIIQGRSLNALIIPRRAFESVEAQNEFANVVMNHMAKSGG